MSFPAYEEYNDSGVDWLGRVPDHWDVVPLKFLVATRGGGTPSKTNKKYWDNGLVPWASSKDLKVELLDDTIDHITQFAVEDDAAELVDAGSLLVVVRGMILAHTFPVVKLLVPMAINQDLKALTPKEQLDPDYLSWMLRGSSRETLDRVDEAAHGTKVLRMDSWLRTLFAIPPLDEQEAISAFLDVETAKIDALVSEQRRLIELLKEKRQAVISHAVTKGLNPEAPMKPSGIPWPIEIPEHWEVSQLRRKMELQRGVDITKDEQIEGDVPVVSSGGISSYHNQAIVDAPGVVLGRKGSVGSIHYIEKDYWPHDTTLYVKEFRGNLPRFLYYKMCSMDLASYDTGSSNPTLNRNVLHPVRVPWPPLYEQEEIVEHLDSVFAEFDTLEAEAGLAIELLQERRTALISAAVTGKIDVRAFANRETT
ncbi:restriction endonuclease subunit S [Rosistilla oblonga]|uniref:EcoKI restriction-modification system protein HsdS n=1 Tax=Rosistilla oblonga TaxID=2527990 RepID=A0A518ITQ7_9BACT|nr:restriction endonuclease subunit S [Rosistilla oblonga]QDV56471.1 EcoKI restriction-modification system protein HsdS [Rosistilla oblonga]